MKDCSCDPLNLVMTLEDSDGNVWVECDLCGNKTRKYKRDEDAEFYWNEFQFRRGRLKHGKEGVRTGPDHGPGRQPDA